MTKILCKKVVFLQCRRHLAIVLFMLWSFLVFKLHSERVKGTETFIQAEGTLKAWNLVVSQPKVKKSNTRDKRRCYFTMFAGLSSLWGGNFSHFWSLNSLRTAPLGYRRLAMFRTSTIEAGWSTSTWQWAAFLEE